MLLEPGMVVYGQSHYSGLRRYVIDRVTEKQAIVKISDTAEIRFDSEVGDGTYFHARGETTGYGREHFAIETPKLKAQYLRAKAIYAFSEIKPINLSDDQLARILAIVAEGRHD